MPIVRGQNNTAAGIANAIVGGNEQQQVTLATFNGATQSFQISLGGNTSTVLGLGGAAVSNANVAAAINAIAGFAGGATVNGAGNGGFTVTFAGASAGVDVPGDLDRQLHRRLHRRRCARTPRAARRCRRWPAGATADRRRGHRRGLHPAARRRAVHRRRRRDPFSVTNATGATGSVRRDHQGRRRQPRRRRDRHRQRLRRRHRVRRHRLPGHVRRHAGDQPSPLGLTVDGGTGFVGETARGGPIQNKGFTVTNTGNFAPDVTGRGQLHDPAAHAVRADGHRRPTPTATR